MHALGMHSALTAIAPRRAGVFLSLVAAIAAALICAKAAADTAAPEAASPTSKVAAAPAAATFPAKTASPLMLREPGTGSAWQMVSSVLVVLLLIVACFVLVKKVFPKVRSGSGRNLSVLETAYLGPSKAVHLLKVGRERYLIGSSKDGVSMLACVTNAVDSDFRDTLKQASDKAAGEAKP